MKDNVIDDGNNDGPKFIDCPTCKGSGGYDAATDCEVYDDWQECPDCLGTGEIDENEGDFHDNN
jgi:DnaJ-class molecular chaperone